MKKLAFLVVWLLALSSYAKTSAVIEEWNTNLDVRKTGNLTITEYMKVKILEEEGYAYSVFRTYYNSFRSVKSIRYTVYDGTGKRIKKLGKEDAVDVMLNPSYEVADSRLLYLEPQYRNYPFTVVIEVEIHCHGFIDFPLWMPRYSHNLEVQKATLNFTCSKDYTFRSASYNGIPEPLTTLTDDLKQLTWSVENLPPVASQRSYKAFAADQAKVYLAPYNFELDKRRGSFETWQNFGDWYLQLNPDEINLSEKTKKELDLISAASRDQKEMVEQVYKFMQRKTRYVSIQLGIGGYKALPVSQVDKSGYGDCKALSSYTKAMLNYLKIPSNYVLVNAGKESPDLISDFPSNQFNHVFLGVPLKSDTLWLECTSQIIPPSYLGSFTDDRDALWIHEGKSKIIHTPRFTAEQSKKINDCQAVLDMDGNMTLVVKRTQSGIYCDEILAYSSLGKDQLDEYNIKKFPYQDFTIQSFGYSQQPDQQIMNLDFRIKVNGLAKRADNKMILPANMLSPLESEVEVDLLNKKSIVRNGFTWEDNVEIVIPENYYVHYIPPTDKIVTEFGTMVIVVTSAQNNTIKINRRMVINKGLYTTETCERFNSFLKKVRTHEQAKIVIQGKT